MHFTFTVDVEVEREEGKFASRDELANLIGSTLEDADEGTYTTDEDATYATTSWDVVEQPQPKRQRRRKA